MVSCEEKLCALAEQGRALNVAFRAARDAVRGTADRDRKWQQFNQLMVAVDAEYIAILYAPAAKAEPETPETAEEDQPISMSPAGSLFDMDGEQTMAAMRR